MAKKCCKPESVTKKNEEISIECCSLIQYSPDLLYILDTKGNILETNPNVVKRLGYTKDELIGSSILKIFTPESKKSFKDKLSQMLEKGYYKAESDLLTKKGEIIHIECEGTAYKNEKGEIERIIVFEHDITNRKKIENELQQKTSDLKERVKELKCLYNITDLANDISNTKDKLFQKALQFIPAGWQYPDITCARIVFNKQEYRSKKFRETAWKQCRDIFIGKQKEGVLEVYYLEERPESDEGPFLKEERNLINAIAVQIGETIERKRAIDDLQESEGKKRLLLETIINGVLENDLNGRITYANPAYLKMYGYKKSEEVVGKKHIWDGLKDKEAIKILKDYFNDVIREQPDPVPYHSQEVTKDGQSIDVRVDWNYLRDANGKLTGFTSIITDITESKKAEEKLNQSNELYSDLANTQPMGIYRIRVLSGKIVNSAARGRPKMPPYVFEFANDRFCEIFRQTRQAIEETPGIITDLVYEDDKSDWIEINSEASRKLIPFKWEGRFIVDKELVWLHLESLPRKLKSGDVIWTGICFDITDRKRNEALLQESEKRFKELANLLPQPVWETNIKGEFIYTNRAGYEILGYTMEDLNKGIHIGDVIAEEDRKRAEINFSKVMSNEDIENHEYFCLKKDGTRFPALIYSTSVIHEGNLTGIRGITLDITERKKAEDELRAKTEELEYMNRELESFAYAASHDLKAPLRAVNNLASWIEEDLRDVMKKDTKEKVELMRSRVSRMDKLLDDLLVYARIGRIERKTEKVDVQKVIQDTVDLLSPPKEFKIEIVTDVPVFETEKVSLEHILENLIDNAIKHHDREDGCVQIAVKDIDCCYEFTVSDDGPGIDKKNHSKVFQLFQTLRPRDEVEGSGMGMAMVKKIIETYGGYLILDSEPGRGTSVQFSWPKKINAKCCKHSDANE
ncbi:PAS domain S-box protein [Candidatus Margulisiibacteriota bacterium]